MEEKTYCKAVAALDAAICQLRDCGGKEVLPMKEEVGREVLYDLAFEYVKSYDAMCESEDERFNNGR